MSTKPLDRVAIARALRDVASLLALAGEEPFRARAYGRAAGTLEHLDVDLAVLIDAGRLTELPGVGRGLAAVIEELYTTGRSKVLDALRKRLPPGALELSRVPGLSLTRIAALHAALGVETIADLRAACQAGRTRGVRGIGEKTERRILERINTLDGHKAVRLHLHRALALAESLTAYLAMAPVPVAVQVAGDLRRFTETVDRLVIVAAASAPEAVVRHALAFPMVASVEAHDSRSCSVVLLDGVPLHLLVIEPDRFASGLLYATGALHHLHGVERIARERQFLLGPAGLIAPSGDRVATPEEGDIYRELGLPYIPPELREGSGELAAALRGLLPDDLLTEGDLRGFVHCHTVYSDGKHSIEAMARAADAVGMQYLTITDHSPSAFYAGGLDVDRLKAQWDEIARVQETVSVRLLRGTESDILADGGLDYPDAILEQMDVVIASIHARHRMDADRMTRRLVRAMQHPCFKIWGHALGRLVLSRPPIECRVEEVLDAAAATSRVAIEINGDPYRLDMEPRLIRAALARGLRFVVSTDAHSVSDLGNHRYGVAMARRGWVRRDDVLNTLEASAFARAVSPAGQVSGSSLPGVSGGDRAWLLMNGDLPR